MHTALNCFLIFIIIAKIISFPADKHSENTDIKNTSLMSKQMAEWKVSNAILKRVKVIELPSNCKQEKPAISIKLFNIIMLSIVISIFFLLFLIILIVVFRKNWLLKKRIHIKHMQQTIPSFKHSTSQCNSSRPSSSQNGTSQKVTLPIGLSRKNSKNAMLIDLNPKINDEICQHNTSEKKEHKPSAPPRDSNASIVIISASKPKEIINNELRNEEQISLIQNSCSNDISKDFDNDTIDHMADTITEKLKNLRFKKACNCMANCINNYCTCRKVNVQCTNECHKGSNCANK
jgi:hypothetical protein